MHARAHIKRPTFVGRSVETGRLHRIHRGVYAVGHRKLTREGHWLAAVLACGDGALLSHLCAAAHLGLHLASPLRTDVIVGSRAGRRHRKTIRVHRPRSPVHDSERWNHDAIPVTSPSRTLLDIAAILSPPSLARAVERADKRKLFDLRAVTCTLAHQPHHPGAPRLTRVLDSYRDDVLTRSTLEAIFRALCATHGIAPPAVNTLVDGDEVDFLWRRQRLVAETDGYGDHGTRAAFERDRAKDARLALAGYRVVRFTERQVTHAPAEVAATLRGLIAGGAEIPEVGTNILQGRASVRM